MKKKTRVNPCPDLSVVIPIYRNSETLEELLFELEQIIKEISGKVEVLFVIDGQDSESEIVIKNNMNRFSFDMRLLLHSRNFGSFMAIKTGMCAARGNFLVTLSADLQDPPSLIPRMFQALSERKLDVVLGRREKRKDGKISHFTSWLFWAFYKRFVDPQIPKGGVDIFGCTRSVALMIADFRVANSSIISNLFWIGLNREEISYSRGARKGLGKSGWNFSKRLRYANDLILSTSNFPARIIFLLGALGGGLLFFVAFSTVFQGSSKGVMIPAYVKLMIGVSLMSLLNLFAISILAAYLWRIYHNTFNRPDAIYREWFPDESSRLLSSRIHRE